MVLQISFVYLHPLSPFRHRSYGAFLSTKEIKASHIKPTEIIRSSSIVYLSSFHRFIVSSFHRFIIYRFIIYRFIIYRFIIYRFIIYRFILSSSPYFPQGFFCEAFVSLWQGLVQSRPMRKGRKEKLVFQFRSFISGKSERSEL